MIEESKINLSIIIPHYNSPKTLSELLKSIGIHDDIEVIVVDDHSSMYINEYQKCKEEYSNCDGFFFFENDIDKKGAGSSRNVGLKNARGNWILFADADDLFLNSMYNEVSQFFDSDYDIVYFPPYIDPTKKTRDVVRNYSALCDIFQKEIEGSETLLRYQFIVPWSKLINSKIIKKNQIWFEDVMYSNDVMFSTYCGFYANKVNVSQNPIYFSSATEGSLINKKTETSFFVRAEVNCRYFAFLYKNVTKKEKQYLSTIAPLRTLLRIIKNGYGYSGITKYVKLLQKYEVPLIQPEGFFKTISIKKAIKRSINKE